MKKMFSGAPRGRRCRFENGAWKAFGLKRFSTVRWRPRRVFPSPRDAIPPAAETLSAPRPHLRVEGLTRYKQAVDSAVRISSRLSIVSVITCRVVHEFSAPAQSFLCSVRVHSAKVKPRQERSCSVL